MKKVFYLFLLFCLMFSISCKENKIKETLEITETDITLYEEESYIFNVNVKVVLETSNSDIVLIEGTKITALNEGEAIITIKLESDETVYKDVVIKVIKKVNILDSIKDNIDIEEREEYTFDVDGIIIISSDEEVVTVNNKTIKGLKVGTILITVYDENDNSNSKDVIVEVKEKTYKLSKLVGYDLIYDGSNGSFLEGLDSYTGEYDLKENLDHISIDNKGISFFTRKKTAIAKTIDIFENLEYRNIVYDYSLSYENLFLHFMFSSNVYCILTFEVFYDGTVLMCFGNTENVLDWNFMAKLPDDFDYDGFIEYYRQNDSSSRHVELSIGETYEVKNFEEGAKLYLDDSDVVIVEGNKITAVNVGKASLIYQVGDQEDTRISITVFVYANKNLKFIPSTLTISVNEEYKFKHKTNQDIVILVSDENIISVDEDVITGLKEGETVVTIFLKDDENEKIDVTLTVVS